MPEKISLEEEQKLIGISKYIKEIENKQVIDPVLLDIKDKLLDKLQTLIIPIGQDLATLKELKMDINELINDPIYSDLYDDQLTMMFKNHLSNTDKHMVKMVQVVRIFEESLLEIFEKSQDIGPKTKPFFMKEGESVLSDEERERFKAKVTRFVLRYKKEQDDGSVKYSRLIAKRLMDLAETTEKYQLINYIFFEYTGEYVLDKLKREMEKPKEDKVEEPVS